jgi:hypothetical protein
LSTTTKNFGLVKPELTDVADITAMNPNWDKVDELLKDFKDIPANANLNDYTEVGNYACSINARVGTLTNCPTTIAFCLHVGKHAGIYQRLVEYNPNTPKVFFRNKDDTGKWGNWHREYTTANKPTPSDIGALPIEGGQVGDLTVAAQNLKPLKAVNEVDKPCYTHYSGNEGALGFLGFCDVDTPAFINSSGNAVKNLYHTGNITSGVADLAPGTSALPTGALYFVYE